MKTRHYFAYGSNIDTAQMKFRCPDTRMKGTGWLDGFRFIINEHGYATIVPDAEMKVYGVIWLLPQEDEHSLDVYEDVAENLYQKHELNIRMSNRQNVEALVYIAANSKSGIPAKTYMSRIIQSAMEHDFPDNYIKELSAWKSK